MTISFTKKWCLLPILLLFAGRLFSQDYGMFYEPQIAINHTINSAYKINFSLVSRSSFYENNAIGFEQKLLEINHFSSISLNDFETISLGIKYRSKNAFENGEDEIRITQQFNVNHKKNIWRLGHRFRAEQRFSSNTVFRFRYRLAMDRPLNGEKLDVGEAYFVLSGELLHSLAKNNAPETDHRWSIQIGWLWSKKLKFQFGLEHRMANFLNKANNTTFLLSSFAIKI